MCFRRQVLPRASRRRAAELRGRPTQGHVEEGVPGEFIKIVFLHLICVSFKSKYFFSQEEKGLFKRELKRMDEEEEKAK